MMYCPSVLIWDDCRWFGCSKYSSWALPCAKIVRSSQFINPFENSYLTKRAAINNNIVGYYLRKISLSRRYLSRSVSRNACHIAKGQGQFYDARAAKIILEWLSRSKRLGGLSQEDSVASVCQTFRHLAWRVMRRRRHESTSLYRETLVD